MDKDELKEKLIERGYYYYSGEDYGITHKNYRIQIEYIDVGKRLVINDPYLDVRIIYIEPTLILGSKYPYYTSKSMNFVVYNPWDYLDQVLDEIDSKAKAFVGFIKLMES